MPTDERAHSSRQEKLLLALLVLCHIILGVHYSVAVPIWEAHDEIGHYAKIRYIAMERRLPPVGQTTAPAQDETHQPPVYYLVAALPVSLLDLEGPLEYRPNPFVSYADAQGGHNVAIHDASVEAWPYQGDVLGVHLARWVSVLFGALAVVVVYLSGRALWPDRPALRWVSALFLAAWPQFRFSTAVVNNDIAVILAAAVTLYGSVLLLVDDRSRHSALVLALGVALLATTKTSGLPLIITALLALGYVAVGMRRRRKALALLSPVIIAALLAGWWYARNLIETGGLLTGPWASLGDQLGHEGMQWLTREQVANWASWRHAFRTFWAGFGYNNVAYPPWVYLAALIIVLPSSVGLLVWVRKGPPRDEWIVVTVSAMTVCIAFAAPQVLWSLRGWTHVQGRYLLPGLPALALVAALGWVSLAKLVRTSWLTALPLGAMVLLSVITPAWIIRPAYAFPHTISPEQLDAYERVRYRFGVSAELVGLRIFTPMVNKGEVWQAELVWRAIEPTWAPMVLSAKMVDETGTLLAEITRFPGNGALATDVWKPGLYVEQLALHLPTDLEPQAHRAVWLDVSLHPRWAPHRPLRVFDEGWTSLGRTLRLGPTKLRGLQQTRAELSPVNYAFGEDLLLTGIAFRADEHGLVVDTAWRALADLDVDLHLSLQLRDHANAVIAQHDGPLANGRLPTSLWEAGDQLVDQRPLPKPTTAQSELALYLCVYEIGSLRRWEVSKEDEPLGSELLLGVLLLDPLRAESRW